MDAEELVICNNIELKEGVEPLEYDGTVIELPTFDPSKRYGMWITLKKFDTNERLIKMFLTMGSFMPVELAQCVHVIHKFGQMEDGSIIQTIGWKYMPRIIDENEGKDRIGGNGEH